MKYVVGFIKGTKASNLFSVFETEEEAEAYATIFDTEQQRIIIYKALKELKVNVVKNTHFKIIP